MALLTSHTLTNSQNYLEIVSLDWIWIRIFFLQCLTLTAGGLWVQFPEILRMLTNDAILEYRWFEVKPRLRPQIPR